MPGLSPTEGPLFEALFGMSSGYVLNFSNNSFKNFIKNIVNLDIDNCKYYQDGESKAKRLRVLLRIEPDIIVGKLLLALIEYHENSLLVRGEAMDLQLINRCKAICSRLIGKPIVTNIIDEESLLKREFKNLPVDRLNIESSILDIIEQRIKEIQACLNNGAPLATIFLCGSTLEGILLGFAYKNMADFNRSSCSPKDKDGKVKQFSEWSLNNLIEVAHNIGLIDPNVKNFTHALRDFRNYIHPYEQMSSRFNPDKHTGELSWKVLQLAIFQLTKTKY